MSNSPKTTRPVHPRSNATGVAEKPQRLSAPVAAPRKVIVTIGIDFGTSSTKVFFQYPETKVTPFVCLFDGNPIGYPPVGLPSTVRVVDGKVYFAAEAEARSGGVVFRSFKTCLRCKLVSRQCIHCADGPKASPGHRMLPDGESDVPPEELAGWYLAYVISQINKRVHARYGNDVVPHYNVAAPMDVIQAGYGRAFYERAVFLAEKLAHVGVAEQGADIDGLRFQYHQLSTDTPTLPGEGDRRTFVVAETRAGMVAYSNSRTAVKGLYSLIDIGAGTTDMTIFRLPADPYPPQFYAADVQPVGADVVDSLLLDEVIKAQPGGKERRSELLGRIRVAKQTGQHQEIFSRQAYKQAAERVGAELFKRYKNLWHLAYKKEVGVDRWQELTMFLIGGGSNLPGLPEILGESPWERQVTEAHVRSLGLPEGIAYDGSGSADWITQYEGLLMVAYGLSFPYAAISAYEMPDGVRPLAGYEPLPKPSWDNSDWDPY